MPMFMMSGVQDKEGEHEEYEEQQQNDGWLVFPHLLDSAYDLRPVHIIGNLHRNRQKRYCGNTLKIKMRLHSEPR